MCFPCPGLFEKDRVPVPFQEFLLGFILSAAGEPKFAPLELAVVFAVVKVVLKSTAHQKLVVRRNGYVSAVEERMHVRSKQETIVYPMKPTLSHRLDVRSFEDRECFLASDGALTLVDVRHPYAKGPLPESLSHGYRFPEHRPLKHAASSLDHFTTEPQAYGLPKSLPCWRP